jgi:uncharacterized protein YecT (DUF1311 family)
MMKRRDGADNSQLLATQRAWITERDEKCPVTPESISSYDNSRDAARCISEATMARMDALLELNGTPRLNLAPLLDQTRH